MKGELEEPCHNGMFAAKRSLTGAAFLKERKKYIDITRHERLKNAERSKWNANEDIAGLSGNLSPTLRPMDEVCKDRLSVGLTFPNCDIINLQNAEEANLRHIYFSTRKSDSTKLLCKGTNFKGYATNVESHW